MWKWFAVSGVIAAVLLPVVASAQVPFDNLQRERARQMLRDLRDAMEHHYYDPKFHGVDMQARFQAADMRLQSVDNLGAALTTIAETLDALKDSHTFFLPPSRNTHREYGYVLQMIGDRCFITAVRPNRDASEKLSAGDEVVTWQGFTPTRETLWTMSYVFNTLVSLRGHEFCGSGIGWNDAQSRCHTQNHSGEARIGHDRRERLLENGPRSGDRRS